MELAALAFGLVVVVSVNAVCFRAVKKPPNVTYRTMPPLEAANKLVVELTAIRTNLHHLNGHASEENIRNYRNGLVNDLGKVIVKLEQSAEALNK